MRKTRDTIWILYPVPERNPAGGWETAYYELAGADFYGYWKSHLPSSLAPIEDFEKIWPEAKIELRLKRLDPDACPVFLITLRILTWPPSDTWLTCVEASLDWFLDQGAAIAWCGGEEGSAAVEIFSPEVFGPVYAAKTSTTGFLCNADLDDEYELLTDDQLQAVHATI